MVELKGTKQQFSLKPIYKFRKQARRFVAQILILFRRSVVTSGHFIVGTLGILLIVALRPFVSIKLANTFSGRIGHFTVNTELALLEHASNQNIKRREIILWIQWHEVSNSFLAEKWKERINAVPYPFLVSTWFIISKFKLSKYTFSSSASDRDIFDLLPRFPPILSLTTTEIHRAQKVLVKMGVPMDSKWVCIHARDSAYLRSEYPLSDYSYHDFRDTDIEDYEPAMLALANLGYYVIRMGKFVEKGISVRHPMIFDYASSEYRQDFLDIYLAARCSFFVSSGSGIDGVATIFRRPQLFVNLALPLHPIINKHEHMFIYKHFFDVTSKQKLSLKELLARGISEIATSQGFVNAGIEMRSNSPMEILQAVLDMNKLLANCFKVEGDDLEHQRAFWGAFPRITRIHGEAPFRATIGPSFLQKNLHLSQ